jgi:hypothetical protein
MFCALQVSKNEWLQLNVCAIIKMLKAFLLFNEHRHKHVDIVKNVLMSIVYKFNSHTHTPNITFRSHFQIINSIFTKERLASFIKVATPHK